MEYEVIEKSTVFPSQVSSVECFDQPAGLGRSKYKLREMVDFQNTTQFGESFQYVNLSNEVSTGDFETGIHPVQLILVLFDHYSKVELESHSVFSDAAIKAFESLLDAWTTTSLESLTPVVPAD